MPAPLKLNQKKFPMVLCTKKNADNAITSKGLKNFVVPGKFAAVTMECSPSIIHTGQGNN